MTKHDAIALEALCEKRFSAEFGESVEISMALTGRLRVAFSDGYITFDYKTGEINYFRYEGFKDDFDGYCQTIKEICATPSYQKDLEALVWSYEHRRELTEG